MVVVRLIAPVVSKSLFLKNRQTAMRFEMMLIAIGYGHCYERITSKFIFFKFGFRCAIFFRNKICGQADDVESRVCHGILSNGAVSL